jgi:rsbT co-antagonist protein RsbR
MNDEGRQLLREVLHRRRAEIIEEATDWVRARAIDLGTKRPREETRKLCALTFNVYEAVLLAGDMTPVRAYIDHITTFRAAREFHVSTLLRGVLSIRWVLERFLRQDIGDGWTAFDLLTAVDAVYYDIAFQVADTYTFKLNETIQTRRMELEVELCRTAEVKARELDDKIAIIESQRRMLAELSAPVIRVWEGVLVIPLVGEITADRAGDLLERALGAIDRSGAEALILDITGLTLMDTEVALRVLRLLTAARLLGADGMLVGASSQIARTLVDLGVDLGEVRTFSTLHEGLRAALRPRSAMRNPA